MNCYLCRTPMKFAFHKRSYDIWRCPSCGLGMTDFRKTYEAFIPEFYNKGYFTGKDDCGAYSDYKRDKSFIAKNIRKIFSRVKRPEKGGRLLDVGCAMGYLVETALKAGWDAHGVDVSRYAVSKAPKALAARLTVASLDSMSYEKHSFDCITMLDVVEHLQDPRTGLKKLNSLLTKNGTILITTGNANSLFAHLMGKHWTFYTPPQHLYFFTKQTFATLLSQAGFVPVKWFGIGKWLSLGYVLHLAATSADFKIAHYLKQLSTMLHMDSIPVYLPVGDNMIVIARKK